MNVPANGSVTITIVPVGGSGSGTLQTTVANSGSVAFTYRIDTETGTVYRYTGSWLGNGNNGAADVSGSMPVIGGFGEYEVRVAGLTGDAFCKIIPRWWRA